MKNTRRKKSSKSTNSVRNFGLMLLCGAIMIGGFFFAARQHFNAMDFGMKNSKLRRQLTELEAEKRRLLLNREVSVSPSELKRSAKKAGLLDTGGNNAGPQLASAPAPAMADRTPAVKATAKQPQQKPLVVKTAAVKAVNQPTTALYVKEQKSERPRKVTQAE